MLEAGYQFDLLGKEAQIALGYQGTREALALALPETRGLVTFPRIDTPRPVIGMGYWSSSPNNHTGYCPGKLRSSKP